MYAAKAVVVAPQYVVGFEHSQIVRDELTVDVDNAFHVIFDDGNFRL